MKCKTSKMAFVQMENLEKFLKACQKYGVKLDDCFQVVDLYEHQNPWSVVCTLFALGRKVSGTSPRINRKESIPPCTSACLLILLNFCPPTTLSLDRNLVS